MAAETLDQWFVVEPGVIVLPTTRYEIRYGSAGFCIWHNGQSIWGGYQSLDAAKRDVLLHMRNLLAVGLEP